MKTPTITAILALSALLLPAIGQAQVVVGETDSFNGTLYTYNYSITNNGTDTLFLTTLTVLADPTAVQNAVAPTGFQVAFDSGLGLVSFLEDSDPLTAGAFDPGTTVSGFSFQSAFGPQSTVLEADDLAGNVFFVPTVGPASAVPEPGAFALGLMLASGLVCTSLRRRKARRA